MGLGALRKGMMHTELRASLIRHHRPSLRAREKLRPVQPSSHPGPTQPPASAPFPHPHLRGASYLCSCPTPATRKSPALENLRLLMKPTWEREGCQRDGAHPTHGLACTPGSRLGLS